MLIISLISLVVHTTIRKNPSLLKLRIVISKDFILNIIRSSHNLKHLFNLITDQHILRH